LGPQTRPELTKACNGVSDEVVLFLPPSEESNSSKR
jgi:hypothetical protein